MPLHQPRARCSPDHANAVEPNMESCVGPDQIAFPSSLLTELSWSAHRPTTLYIGCSQEAHSQPFTHEDRHGRPSDVVGQYDKDPPPSRTERISPMIHSSQIRSNHDARIKGNYLGGQVKEATIKKLPYWRLNYKYDYHRPNTGYAI